MKVRAKLRCISIEGEHVKFQCQYDSENSPEDNSFSKYTPWGNAEFGISNPDALSKFEVGKDYYFDMTAVPSGKRQSNEQSETNEDDDTGGSQPPPGKGRP